MAEDFLADVIGSVIDGGGSALDTATETAAHALGEVVQQAAANAPVADYASVAQHLSSLAPDLQFAASDWVDPAHSGFLHERVNGVYTGNWVKASTP
jgi:hypothetical protein